MNGARELLGRSAGELPVLVGPNDLEPFGSVLKNLLRAEKTLVPAVIRAVH